MADPRRSPPPFEDSLADADNEDIFKSALEVTIKISYQCILFVYR